MGTSAAPEPNTALTARLLGEFRLALDGRDVAPRGRKTRAMLAILAVHPDGRCSRERLAELLWGDRGEEQARGSLRQALAELKSGPVGQRGAIVASREHLTLDLGLLATDIGDVEAAAARGDTAALAAALGAIGGDFLSDLSDLSPSFADWLAPERARLKSRISAAACRALEAAVDNVDPAHAREAVQSLERMDPADECVARIGLRLDHRAGDYAALHRRYRRLEETLKKEFGIGPAPETRDLLTRLTALAAPTPPLVDQVKRAGAPPIVLISPFQAIDRAPDSTMMAALCTDDARTLLARHRDLRVIAFGIDDAERVAAVCAGALASFRLSGTIRAVGRALVVNVNLDAMGTGVVVWSEQIEVEEAALYGALAKVVGRVVGAVGAVVEIESGRLADTAEGPFPLYARARRLVRNADDIAKVREGAELLERAVVEDPTHVGARLLLAQIYNTDYWQLQAGHDPAPLRARALSLATEAASIDPENPEVHLRLGWCHLRSRDWSGADAAFQHALRLRPFDPHGLNAIGLGLVLLDRFEDAESLFQRAFALNPFPPSDYYADRGVLTVLKGEHLVAEEQFSVANTPSLHYLAYRLLNLALSNATDRRIPMFVSALFNGFRKIWIGKDAPSGDDILLWLDVFLPLVSAEHRLYRDGQLGPLLRGFQVDGNSALLNSRDQKTQPSTEVLPTPRFASGNGG